jgi:hypothetical protein
MSFFKRLTNWLAGTPTPVAHNEAQAMTGTMPNYEPIEVPAKGESKPAKSKKTSTKHTKASLKKMTKSQLEALGRKEFNIELDKRKTKAKLVTELLNTVKKVR